MALYANISGTDRSIRQKLGLVDDVTTTEQTVNTVDTTGNYNVPVLLPPVEPNLPDGNQGNGQNQTAATQQQQVPGSDIDYKLLVPFAVLAYSVITGKGLLFKAPVTAALSLGALYYLLHKKDQHG